MITLENKYLKAVINPTGAELTKIYSKVTQTDYLWNGDASYWGRHAPILFPIIGKLKDDYCFIDNQKYTINKHGFVREALFTVVSKNNTEVVLEFQYSKNTLQSYPFKFSLKISYKIENNKLSVEHNINNIDNKTIYFAIGGHPAFNCPLTPNSSFNDYYLEFEQEETPTLWMVNMKTGLCSGQTKQINLGNKLNLNYDLFKNDALIFEKLKSKKVILKSNKHNLNVSMSLSNWKFLAFWTKKEAPFICFEPWTSLPDLDNSNNDFTSKIGIEKLAKGKTFTNKYDLVFN
ncbi:MAG: aldose 1-epimerase family protein [Tenacibaculum sp.]